MNSLPRSRMDSSITSVNLHMSAFRYQKAWLYFCGVFLVIWLSGCSAVNPKPFKEYNEAAGKLTKVDDLVDAHASAVKESDLARIALDKDKVTKLTLQFDESDPYWHRYKFTPAEEPPFIKWQRFDSGLSELNLSFVEYTRLLAELAGGELIKTDDFDALATDLNNNARSALQALGKEPDASRLALFSTAASSAAHNYISTKRKQYLIDIVNDNQPLVDAYINHGRDAVGILADDIKAENQNSNRSLLKQWASSNSNSGKIRITEQIYSSNDVTGKTLDMLRGLDNSYKSLAETHKALAAGLENGSFSVSGLTADIQRIQKLYKDLAKANEEAEKAAETAGQGT